MTTTKPPAEVWLQWYGDGDPADGDPEPGTVTWHPERVYDSDVGPYVLDVEGLRSRAEKAERERDALRGDAEKWADVCRSVGRDTATDRAADDVSDAVSVLRGAGAPDLPIDEQCMWLVGQRDEERRQRLFEAELAREAIALVRRLAEQAIPTLDECTCSTRGAVGCDVCERREAMAAARAWLEGVRV